VLRVSPRHGAALQIISGGRHWRRCSNGQCGLKAALRQCGEPFKQPAPLYRRDRPIADRRRPWQAASWLFRTSHSRRPQHFQWDNAADADVSLNRASRQAPSGRDHTYRSIKQDRRSFADYWPETSKKDRCQDLGRCQLWLRPNITCYGSLSDRQKVRRSDAFSHAQPSSLAFSRP
jgi:hypothetical protein